MVLSFEPPDSARLSPRALGALALLLCLLALASPATAAPIHPPLPALDITGLNHACGTAVDSKGDVYVASAGESKVKVFDPSHTELTSIPNTEEPCGLAVDSTGKLYVSEQGTGKVVRYTPNAYPFSGTPTYGPATTIDASGTAKGISVDPFDDRLYVAEGDHVDTYNSEGNLGIDEEQRVRVSEATGGTFKLSFKGQETGSLPWNATHAEVQAALEALSSIGAGNVSVTQAEGGSSPTNHLITFKGTLAGTNVPEIFPISELAPNQVDSLTVDATAGTYTLTVATGEGAGTLTSGSNEVTAVRTYFDAFHVGDAISGSGIPEGTTVTEVGSGTLKLSNTATASGAEKRLGTRETIAPIPYNATHENVQAALVELPGIAPGDVTVTGGPGGPGGLTPYTVAFEGAYSGRSIQLDRDQSAITGTATIGTISFGADLFFTTVMQGFNGHIGEGSLSNATGVAVYTYAGGVGEDRYLAAADSAADETKFFSGGDIRTLKLRKTIDGVDDDRDPETPDQELGFGTKGAYLAADHGTCPPAEQACTAGHFFVFDDAHKALDEFEASGQYLTQIKLTDADPGFSDAQPTAIAVDRSGDSGDGTIYVTSGASTGAKLLAFGPLSPPSRPDRPELSFKLPNACGVAVDSYGNRYVAAGTAIYVYPPVGEIPPTEPLATITKADHPCDLAVDTVGNLYALDNGSAGAGDEKAVYYTPDSFPVGPGTKYGGPTTIATPAAFPFPAQLASIGINPANDRVFVSQDSHTIEFDSAENGSGIVDPAFGSVAGVNGAGDIAVYGANGDVYVTTASKIFVLTPDGHEILARISGAGSPKGPFDSLTYVPITVDQANGHIVVFKLERGGAEEYEPSGTFVAQFGSFGSAPRGTGVAVDNSGGPNDGNVYVAYDDPISALGLTAFGPLAYGEPPIALTGTASAVGGGKATLNGTVDPRGFDLTDCQFEYLTDAEYEDNVEAELDPFTGATSKACAESLKAIGKGTKPVPVHTDLSGLNPEGRYRFRLIAQNKYGTGKGKAGLFGPPVLTTKPVQPISYTEATLRAMVDPSGLATKYRFEYGTGKTYGQSTVAAEVSTDGPIDVAVPIFDLAEGTTYHVRLVAENEAKTVEGPDQSFETQQRVEKLPCPNDEFRTGHSANLPDCRAYELITPADTRGAIAGAADAGGTHQFNNWLVVPRGEGAGDSLSFFIDGTLPGFDGNGLRDGYRARRADGLHPAGGWTSELFAPSYIEAGGGPPAQQGVASDQAYSFWQLGPSEVFEGTFDPGSYLRTPAGFEPIGQGSLGTDLNADSRFVTAGANHLIFSSKAHLEDEEENEAAPAGTEAIYDRTAGSPTADVVSLKPGNAPFNAGEDATYVGATEDGSAVVFRVGGALYMRRENTETVKVADGPNTFGGVSEDGKQIFYVDAVLAGQTPSPAGLFVFDAVKKNATEIAPDSRFVNVSADGSHVYFTSEVQLDEAKEGTPGADNLYVWNGEGIHFIAVLDPQDLLSFDGTSFVNLIRWTDAVGPNAGAFIGRGSSPTRSTPDGKVLVFQSHTQLTPYDNEGFSEVYRYDSEGAPGKQLTCVSCDPSNAPPVGNAMLQSIGGPGSPLEASTLIPNVTDDGRVIFFQSEDQLLPEDANGVKDVYEWKANGVGGCKREGGCLALISSGQGEHDNYLYSMTPDGHDVFFTTLEKLVGADITGSPSIYDARKEGGIPDPPETAPCQGDACQGSGSIPPVLPAPTSTGQGGGNAEPKPTPCPKSKHRVKGRCVKPHKKRHHRKHRRANHNRGAHR